MSITSATLQPVRSRWSPSVATRVVSARPAASTRAAGALTCADGRMVLRIARSFGALQPVAGVQQLAVGVNEVHPRSSRRSSRVELQLAPSGLNSLVKRSAFSRTHLRNSSPRLSVAPAPGVTADGAAVVVRAIRTKRRVCSSSGRGRRCRGCRLKGETPQFAAGAPGRSRRTRAAPSHSAARAALLRAGPRSLRHMRNVHRTDAGRRRGQGISSSLPQAP